MNNTEKKFDALLDEIKAMFMVSQVIAKDGFNKTLQDMFNKEEQVFDADAEEIHALGLLLTATKASDKSRLASIIARLQSVVR